MLAAIRLKIVTFLFCVRINIYKISVLLDFIRRVASSLTREEEWIESVREQEAEENIQTQEKGDRKGQRNL
jgi:hypothetical protein